MEITEFFLMLYALANSDTLLGKIIIITYIAGITAVTAVVILQLVLAVKDNFGKH